MKKVFIFSLLAIVIIQSACSSKNADEKDPITTIEVLSGDVEKSADDWDETAWDEAAERLKMAISNLPDPLETKEKESLNSSYDKILSYASQHERKAAKMLEALDDLKMKLGEEMDELDGTYELQGSVDKYPVTMHLIIEGETVKGSYYYERFGPNALLTLSGTNKDGILTIEEFDKGNNTGSFEGKFESGVFKGVFTDIKGKKMAFGLSEAGTDISEISLDDIPIDVMEESSSEDDEDMDEDADFANSIDVDEMLESYDKYVTKYIKYIKKAADGDLTALAEYPGLMEQANDLQEKLERCKGDMTKAQMQRYIKITNRMSEAAQ